VTYFLIWNVRIVEAKIGQPSMELLVLKYESELDSTFSLLLDLLLFRPFAPSEHIYQSALHDTKQRDLHLLKCVARYLILQDMPLYLLGCLGVSLCCHLHTLVQPSNTQSASQCLVHSYSLRAFPSVTQGSARVCGLGAADRA